MRARAHRSGVSDATDGTYPAVPVAQSPGLLLRAGWGNCFVAEGLETSPCEWCCCGIFATNPRTQTPPEFGRRGWRWLGAGAGGVSSRAGRPGSQAIPRRHDGTLS